MSEYNPITKDMLINNKIKVFKTGVDVDITADYILTNYYSLSEYYNTIHDNSWKINGVKQTGELTTILEGNVKTYITIGHQPFNHNPFNCMAKDYVIYYIAKSINGKVRHPRTRILRDIDPPRYSDLKHSTFNFGNIYYYTSRLSWETQSNKGCISHIQFVTSWPTYAAPPNEFNNTELDLDIFNKDNPENTNTIDLKDAADYTTFVDISGIKVRSDTIKYIKNTQTGGRTIQNLLPNLETFTVTGFNNLASILTDLTNTLFQTCSNLTTVNINTSNELNIKSSCFQSCTNLNTVNIIAKTLEFGGNCFYNCTNLTTVTIFLTDPITPTITFGTDSFKATTKLENIYIDSDIDLINISLGSNVFSQSGLEYIGKK